MNVLTQKMSYKHFSKNKKTIQNQTAKQFLETNLGYNQTGFKVL